MQRVVTIVTIYRIIGDYRIIIIIIQYTLRICLAGGFCPEGFCPGGFVPGVLSKWVLSGGGFVRVS